MAHKGRPAVKSVGGRQFRLGELARVLGVDARRVKGWVEQGFIRPAVQGRGPGQPRLFDTEQLARSALLLALQSAFGTKSPLPPQVMQWLDLTWVGLLQGDSPQAHDPNWEDGDEIFYVVSYDAASRKVHGHATLVCERDVPRRLPAFTKPGYYVTLIPILPFIRPIRYRLGLPWPGVEREWEADLPDGAWDKMIATWEAEDIAAHDAKQRSARKGKA